MFRVLGVLWCRRQDILTENRNLTFMFCCVWGLGWSDGALTTLRIDFPTCSTDLWAALLHRHAWDQCFTGSLGILSPVHQLLTPSHPSLDGSLTFLAFFAITGNFRALPNGGGKGEHTLFSLLLTLKLINTVCSKLPSDSHHWVVNSTPVHERMLLYFVVLLTASCKSSTYRNEALNKPNTRYCIPAGNRHS